MAIENIGFRIKASIVKVAVSVCLHCGSYIADVLAQKQAKSKNRYYSKHRTVPQDSSEQYYDRQD